jgi:hypothetical protein
MNKLFYIKPYPNSLTSKEEGKFMRESYIAILVLFALCILLSGCATQRPLQQTTPPPARIGLKLAPATLGQSLSLQQHLIVERAGHTHQLDTVLEINPQHLELVGLAFGQRVMTISYDGNNLQTWRHPYMPAQISGESVLEDIELTLWPTQAIRHALPVGWSIVDNHKRRIIYLNQVPIVIINYPSGRRWGSDVVLTNLRYHYRLTIQSVAI